MDIGEAEIAALVAVGEARMLNPHEVQNRCVEVVHVDAIFNDVVTKIVGLTEGCSFIDARAGHENREAARVVVAPVISLGEGALRVGRATELATPDNEG